MKKQQLKGRVNFPRGLRTELRIRDRHSCRGCRETLKLQPHHIIPRDEGGTDSLQNLILLCNRCHDYIEIRETPVRSREMIIGLLTERFGPEVLPQELEVHPLGYRPIEPWHAWVYGGARNPNK